MPTPDDPWLARAREWRSGRHIDLLRAGISERDAFDRDLVAHARAEVARELRAQATEMTDKLSTGDLLLHAGEMTAGEKRTVRAVLRWRANVLRARADAIEREVSA